VNEDEQDLLSKWYIRADIVQAAHYSASSHLERLHYMVGLPAVLLTTVVGSSIFASLSDTGAQSNTLKIITGIFSIMAASLSAAQTFLRLGERANHHRVGGIRYSSLKREIEQTKVFPPDDLRAYINTVRERWDKLNAECPTIPTRIFVQTEQKLTASEA
jgi:hypothetical protein